MEEICRVWKVKIDEKSKRTKFNWISPQLNKVGKRRNGGSKWKKRFSAGTYKSIRCSAVACGRSTWKRVRNVSFLRVVDKVAPKGNFSGISKVSLCYQKIPSLNSKTRLSCHSDNMTINNSWNSQSNDAKYIILINPVSIYGKSLDFLIQTKQNGS